MSQIIAYYEYNFFFLGLNVFEVGCVTFKVPPQPDSYRRVAVCLDLVTDGGEQRCRALWKWRSPVSALDVGQHLGLQAVHGLSELDGLYLFGTPSPHRSAPVSKLLLLSSQNICPWVVIRAL